MKKLFVSGLATVLLTGSVANADLLTWLSGDTANQADARVALDSSVNGNHGFMAQNVTLTDDGRSGGGFDFADGSSFMKMNPSTWGRYDGIVQNQEFTVAFWMAAEESAVNPRNQSTFWFESPGNNGGARGIQSHTPWSNGQVYLDIGGCCGGTERVNGAVDREFWDSAEGEEWTHWTFTMNNAGDVAVYADGEIMLERAGPTDDIADFAQVWFGSAVNGGNSFAGRMDDIVIADNSLSDDQVFSLYEDGPSAVWANQIAANVPTDVSAASAPVAELVRVAGNGLGEIVPANTGVVRGPAGTEVAPGLAQEWSRHGNGGNYGENLSRRLTAGIEPGAFRAADTDWWSGNGDYETVPKYPAQLADAGYDVAGNNDSYSVVMTGEIKFDADGTYRFRDGVDDYTYMALDLDRSGVAGDAEGEVLINDNNWTGPDASANGGSPLVEVDIDVADDANGEWIAVELMMAEGGGGDSFTLFWNGLDLDNEQIAEAGSVMDDPDLLIPQSHTRSVLPGEITGAVAQLDSDVFYEIQVSSDLLDSDHLVKFGAQLDATGANLKIVADGELVAGDSWVPIVGDDVVGLDAVNLLFDVPGDWDTSSFATNGRIVYTGAASAASVPEPTSATLFGLGAFVVGLLRKRRR